MSSTPAATPTNTSPPSPTNSSGSSQQQDTNGPTANATLYLYTFLATLVLLLAVSSAIVIRSLILRRRHQRMVEEAIRTGTWMPQYNSASGRRRRDIGQKPTLFEAWLNLKHNAPSAHDEKRNWDDIMPFYVAYIHSPLPPSSSPSPQGGTASSAENPVDASSRSSRLLRPFARIRSPPSPQPTTALGQALSSPSSSPTSTPPRTLRVGVLIAMPDPSPKHHHSDESGPPVVEMGVVEVDLEGDEIETPSPNPDSS